MTFGKSIISIFRQNMPFKKILVVWGTKVQALTVRRATFVTTCNLGG
jgi:hypothetical protein